MIEMQSAFLAFVRISLQASLLVLLIMAVQYGLRKRIGAEWRHALWGVLLVKLLLVWALPAPFSVYNLMPQTSMGNVGALRPAHVQTLDSAQSGYGASAQEAIAHDSGAPAFGVSLAPRFDSALHWPLSRHLATLWLAGVIVTLSLIVLQGRRLTGNVAKQRLVCDPEVLELLEKCKQQMGVSTWLAVMETSRVGGPALLGVLRPRLLLPPGLVEAASKEELRHIFLHELAHLKRGDILTSWLFDIALAIHWFNPFLWWIRRCVVADRELACDARVMKVIGPMELASYGRTLLAQFQKFVSSPWQPGLAGVLEGKTNIERRIDMVTQFDKVVRRGATTALAAILVIGAVALTDAQEIGAKSEVSMNTILPGQGLREIGVGNTPEEVEKLFGTPGEGSRENWLNYRAQRGIDFFVGKDGRVTEVRFNPGFKGKTSDGIALQDPLDKAIKASGGAQMTVDADNESTHRVRKGSDRVLYNKKRDGVTTAYKFIDSKKGILYWADKDKRITQIVAFKASRQRDTGSGRQGGSRSNHPTTVFVFSGKDDFKPKSGRELLNAFNEHFPKGGSGRTHHYRTSKSDGEIIGQICADKPQAIAAMLEKSTKLKKVKSWQIETAQDFADYLKKMGDKSWYPTTVFVFAGKDGFNPDSARKLLDAFNEDFRRAGGGRTHHYRTVKSGNKIIGSICADKEKLIADMLNKSATLRKIKSWQIETAEDFDKYLKMSDEERLRRAES